MWKRLILSSRSRPLFEWRLLLSGVDIVRFRELYLDPCEGEATELRCPTFSDCPEKCGSRNVRHLSGGVAACCRHRVDVPHLPLSSEDRGMLGLNYARMNSALCRLFGLEYTGIDLDRRFFWELGALKRGTGRRLPVYLSYYQTAGKLNARIELMLAAGAAPFFLLVGDRSMVKPETVSLLEKSGGACGFLDEAVNIRPDCSLAFASDPLVFFERNDSAKGAAAARYDTAPGTRWGDVHLKKHDMHTVSVWLRGESAVNFSYGKMGMGNAKTGNPSLAFRALIFLLESPDGSLPLPPKTRNCGKDYDGMKQRKKEISAALKKIFHNIDDGDPIAYDKDRCCYTARFQTKSDSDSTASHLSKR